MMWQLIVQEAPPLPAHECQDNALKNFNEHHLGGKIPPCPLIDLGSSTWAL